MPTVTAPVETAKSGVKAATNQTTTVQIQLASIEILVGGPYADHPYGHTALRVTTKSEDRIYDYGRYGLTWGVGNSEGQGILRVWNNFNTYIGEESSLNRITTGFQYELPEEKAQAIIKFYDGKIVGKKPKSITKAMQTYLIDDYAALGSNCTTLSVAAAKMAIPDIDREWGTYQKGRGLSFMEKGVVTARGWPNFIFMPADLQAMLEGSVVRKPKRIKSHGSKP